MADRRRKLMTTAELAAFLGHDPATLRQWRAKGCPSRKHGRTYLFDRTAVAQWLRSRNYDGKPGPRKQEPMLFADADGRVVDPQVRFRLARAEKIELEIAKLKGELVDRVDVVDEYVQRARLFRTSLLGLAARLAPVVAPMDSVAKVERRLRTEFEGVLREFARGTGE